MTCLKHASSAPVCTCISNQSSCVHAAAALCRWACKISEYGLRLFLAGERPNADVSKFRKVTRKSTSMALFSENFFFWSLRHQRECRCMFFHRYSILNDLIGNFWVAPEFLRGTADVTDSSSQQAADVYAAAIIIKEVFARNGPYTEYQEDFAYKPEGGSRFLIQQDGKPSFLSFRCGQSLCCTVHVFVAVCFN